MKGERETLMKIRKAEVQDAKAIYAVVTAAFAGVEHTDGNEVDLVMALTASRSFIPELSLLAEEDGDIIGHIMFTKAKVGTTEVLALAPLSVLPEYQRRGVGAALISEGHHIARQLGYPYAIVLGSDTYYPRHGYVLADTVGIRIPFDAPRENVIAYPLVENTSPIHGVMRYDKAFGIN